MQKRTSVATLHQLHCVQKTEYPCVPQQKFWIIAESNKNSVRTILKVFLTFMENLIENNENTDRVINLDKLNNISNIAYLQNITLDGSGFQHTCSRIHPSYLCLPVDSPLPPSTTPHSFTPGLKPSDVKNLSHNRLTSYFRTAFIESWPDRFISATHFYT